MKSTGKFFSLVLTLLLFYSSTVNVSAKQPSTYYGQASTEVVYLNTVDSDSESFVEPGVIVPMGTISSYDLKITKIATPIYNYQTHNLVSIKIEITWEWLRSINNYLLDTTVVTWDNTTVDWRIQQGSFLRQFYVKQPINNYFVLLSTLTSLADSYSNGFSYDQQLTQYPAVTYNKGYSKFILDPITNPDVFNKTLNFTVKYFHKYATITGFNISVDLTSVLLSGYPNISFGFGFGYDFDTLAVPFSYSYVLHDPNY